MAEKKISAMAEASSLADTDFLVVRTGTDTKKVSMATLKSALGGGGEEHIITYNFYNGFLFNYWNTLIPTKIVARNTLNIEKGVDYDIQ